MNFTCTIIIGLKPAEVVDLCQGALNAGPAMCFVESRNLGTNAERSHLCNGANSAVCFSYVHQRFLFEVFRDILFFYVFMSVQYFLKLNFYHCTSYETVICDHNFPWILLPASPFFYIMFLYFAPSRVPPNATGVVPARSATMLATVRCCVSARQVRIQPSVPTQVWCIFLL